MRRWVSTGLIIITLGMAIHSATPEHNHGSASCIIQDLQETIKLEPVPASLQVITHRLYSAITPRAIANTTRLLVALSRAPPHQLYTN